MKICSKCKQEKPLSDFWKRSDTDKHRSHCKMCINIYRDSENVRKYYRNRNKKPKRIAWSKAYRNTHKKERNAYLKENINYKITHNLRSRLRDAIKRNQKSGSAVRDLGCSITDFKKWLEQQFYINPKTGEAMSWDNYGFYGWHIDHIIPLNHYNLADRTQFKKACHWFNLRPLWAEENLQRNRRY